MDIQGHEGHLVITGLQKTYVKKSGTYSFTLQTCGAALELSAFYEGGRTIELNFQVRTSRNGRLLGRLKNARLGTTLACP